MGRRGKKSKTAKGHHNQESESNKKKKQREPKVVDHVTESDDEEIDEDEAFNSEDERMFGHFFTNKKKSKKKKSDDDDDEMDSDDEEVSSGESGDDDSDDDDDDEEEDDGGQYMLDLLNKLDSNNNNANSKNQNEDGKLSAAQMANIPESEFSSSISKKGLTLDNLMEGLQDTKGFRDLQKTFEKKQTATPAPLSKTVSDRTQRKMTYQKEVENVTGWTDAVQENRKAETLDFKPKERTTLTRDILVDKFEPTTEFEKELEQALEEAGNQDEEAVLKAEEQALQDDLGANKLSMEEYKKRRGQLAQVRALMFYHEQKRHHMKKIKSKKYRRIRKKQRERLKESEMEAAMQEDDELANELKEKEEVQRIQERMTLAHKNTSKWAKRILKRGKNIDVDTRRALSAQLKRGDDLRKKMMGDSDNESDGDSDEDLVESARKVLADTESEENPTHGKTGLFKLSFMQKGIQKQREQAKQEARKLLRELEANERDDFDDTEKDGDDDGDIAKKEKVASKKEMDKVLKEGGLVATSLQFGNSDAIAISGGIEIDVATGMMNEDKKGVGTEKKSEHVTTLSVTSKPIPNDGNDDDDDDTEGQKESKARQVATRKTKRNDDEEEEANPWMQPAEPEETNDAPEKVTKQKKKKKRSMVDIESAADMLDAALNQKDAGWGAPRETNENNEKSQGEDDKNEDSNQKLTMLSQEELVRRAFAAPSDKEVEEDFQKEKEKFAAEDDPTRKVAKNKDPADVAGWGSWTGAGAMPPPRRKRLPKKLRAPKKAEEPKRKRKDDRKPNVIINQKRLKKTANTFMLGDVPHPYSSRAEYEQAMLGGVGKEWNVTNSFKNLTRPEIMTRSGKIIQPISKKVKVARPAAKF